ncbi:hypothetical protein J6590_072624 [Homalodisca vitripennis]|nr:hypothetical protein J6590_072624 [Homalodisca vitripennis]
MKWMMKVMVSVTMKVPRIAMYFVMRKFTILTKKIGTLMTRHVLRAASRRRHPCPAIASRLWYRHSGPACLRQTKENEHTSEYRAGLRTARQRVLIADCSLSQFVLIVEHQ